MQKKLSLRSETFDVAISQGTPDMLNFIPEMARLIKPGGKIASIVYDSKHLKPSESAYETKRYDSWPGYFFKPELQLKQLRLERISVPDTIRRFEHLTTYEGRKGENYSAGVIVEAFTKY